MLAALERQKTFPQTYDGRNVVSTLAPLYLIASSFLQVMRSTIKAWMSSNLCRIPPWTMELAALECGKSIYLSIYLSLLSRSISDHHLRCGGWLNLEFSKREKHSGWAIKTIYKK